MAREWRRAAHAAFIIRTGLWLDPYEEILVYPLLKRRLKRPRVRVRVRLNEQERALGVPQSVGTTIVKMNKNPNEGLKRSRAERKREILREIQDKFRDVRAEAEWKEAREELGTGGILRSRHPARYRVRAHSDEGGNSRSDQSSVVSVG